MSGWFYRVGIPGPVRGAGVGVTCSSVVEHQTLQVIVLFGEDLSLVLGLRIAGRTALHVCRRHRRPAVTSRGLRKKVAVAERAVYRSARIGRCATSPSACRLYEAEPSHVNPATWRRARGTPRRRGRFGTGWARCQQVVRPRPYMSMNARGGSGQPVDIDASAFAEAFARRSIAVRHGLADHPLFTIDAIAELADRLPPDSVRRERGDPTPPNDGKYVDVGDGPPSGDHQERRAHRDPGIAPRHPAGPEYAELIDECLDEVDGLVAERQGGMTQRGIPLHLLPGLDHARCTSIGSTASSSR